MTTGSLDVSVKKGDSAGPFTKVVHNPDISNGETVDPVMNLIAMTTTTRSAESISIDRGHTLALGVTLKSGRKLIVVANRIALSLGGKIKMFKFEDPELIETWFHETACHAGRITKRESDLHGDPGVNRAAIEIETMFPKATTVPKVFAEIQDYLK